MFSPVPPAITAAVLEKVLGFLIPLFLTEAVEPALARQAAWETLASYNVRSNRELRLAALAIAFSFGALDALGQAGGPGVSETLAMRMRGNANALNRAALQNEDRLDKLQRKPVAPEAAPGEAVPEEAVSKEVAPGGAAPLTEAADCTLPASLEPADLVAFLRTQLRSSGGGTVPEADAPAAPISRQQRRWMERQAEKSRRREQEQARLAARAAQRDARAATSAGTQIAVANSPPHPLT